MSPPSSMTPALNKRFNALCDDDPEVLQLITEEIQRLTKSRGTSQASGGPTIDSTAIDRLTAAITASTAVEAAKVAAIASVAQELAALRQPRTRTGSVDLPTGKVTMTVSDAPQEALDAAAAVGKIVEALGQSSRKGKVAH